MGILADWWVANRSSYNLCFVLSCFRGSIYQKSIKTVKTPLLVSLLSPNYKKICFLSITFQNILSQFIDIWLSFCPFKCKYPKFVLFIFCNFFFVYIKAFQLIFVKRTLRVQ